MEVTNKPCSETIYSGGGYTILQLVIEEVTGIPFDRYMEEQIMKPLGMKSSSFYNVLKTITFQKLMDILERSPSYQFTEQAAAGFKTNVIDMMTLILASMDTNNKGNGVIKSERVEEMQKPVLGENGLGIFEKNYLINGNYFIILVTIEAGILFMVLFLIQRMDW